MRKLDKAEVDRIKQISDDIRDRMVDLIVAHGTACDAYRAALESALIAYNEAVQAAVGLVEDIDVYKAHMPTLTEFEEIASGNLADDLDNA